MSRKSDKPSQKAISRQKIVEWMPTEITRPLQIVHGAFLVSVLSMLFVTMAAKGAGGEPKGIGLVQVMGGLGLVVWIGGYAFGQWIWKKRMSKIALHQVLSEPFKGPMVLAATATEGDKLALHLRRTWVARAAAWSGGPVLCLMSLQAAQQGNLVAKDTSLWATGLGPALFLLLLLWLARPTRERQVEWLSAGLSGQTSNR